jgi:hypothetical protein
MEDDGLASTPPDARDARILVAITVHFNAARLEYLAEVLRSLAEFPVAAMHVVLITNTVAEAELGVLQRLCDEVLVGKSASLHRYEYLAHPFYLTWRHREFVATEFGDGSERKYTHFIYLEDDIRLSFMNFCYFVTYREVLRDAGLLPSFLRVEFNKTLNGYVNSDTKVPVDLNEQPREDRGEMLLANMPFPYTACYVLDADLAREFLGTSSFGRERSRAMTEWDVRERAAMGLCYENIPNSFQCRYVVPIVKASGMALNCAWVSHLPNNYANDANSAFGKVRMDSLFVNAGGSAPRGGGDGGRTGLSRWRNADFYMVLPNKVIEGMRWRLGIKR